MRMNLHYALILSELIDKNLKFKICGSHCITTVAEPNDLDLEAPEGDYQHIVASLTELGYENDKDSSDGQSKYKMGKYSICVFKKTKTEWDEPCLKTKIHDIEMLCLSEAQVMKRKMEMIKRHKDCPKQFQKHLKHVIEFLNKK